MHRPYFEPLGAGHPGSERLSGAVVDNIAYDRLLSPDGSAGHVVWTNKDLVYSTITIWFAMARLKDITIHVPRELRAYCNGASELMLSAPSVRVVLEELERLHPLLYRGICDDTGAVRRHVNVFVNKDHMRDRDGLDTALVPGDEIMILPAVSGG